jgi:hypothetical protein
MKRDIKILWEMYKGEHGNPFAEEKTPIAIYGRDGEYFALDDGDFGQGGHNVDKSIIDYNTAPGQTPYNGTGDFEKIYKLNQKKEKEGTCQPGLWCQWIIEGDGEALVWDGGEKFYNYVEWLKYLIAHFFSKWGVLLNGTIHWTGEDSTDMGQIVVENNVVKVLRGVITYEEEE